MEKTVGIKLADWGYGSRIGQEENGKNVSGGKKCKKQVHRLARKGSSSK
jgi:hypothetical protein